MVDPDHVELDYLDAQLATMRLRVEYAEARQRSAQEAMEQQGKSFIQANFHESCRELALLRLELLELEAKRRLVEKQLSAPDSTVNLVMIL